MRKSHLKEKLVKTPVIIEKVQELISENPKAVSDEISKNLGWVTLQCVELLKRIYASNPMW